MLTSIALLLALSIGAKAEIRETHHLREIFVSLQPGDQVFLDLDNTTFESAQMLGGDAWGMDFLERLINKGISLNEAQKQEGKLFDSINAKSAVRLIEKDTPELIAQARARGHQVHALTARRSRLTFVTEQQTKSLGLQYSLSENLEENAILGPKTLYRSGIIFANGLNKGHALLRFFAATRKPPGRVIIVDDKKSNLEEALAALTGAGIPTVAWLYKGAGFHTASYDLQLARIEEAVFIATGRLISDNEAKQMIDTPSRLCETILSGVQKSLKAEEVRK